MTTPKENRSSIAITSTFTSEPIDRTLSFWFRLFGWSWDIAFAPYNQVFQQLLDPTSLVSQNQAGANLYLIRFEDWLQNDDSDSGVSALTQHSLSTVIEQFIAGLSSVNAQSTVPAIVCVCPPSPDAISIFGSRLESWSHQLQDAIAALSNIHLLEWHDAQSQLSVESIHDPEREKLGRIPYTEDFFIALGTAVIRKLFAIQHKPYKVIVLDCDNTLWSGVVGEDGPQGVTISPAHHRFQELLIEQFDAGMLLCLCSKNVESDVLTLFDERPDMPLKREHLVAWRINWQPKSQNILELANELELGLDSFVFIDDNPVECAEVQANCPEVLTIQFPKVEADIDSLSQNIWAFDRLQITAEDKKRTQMYRENVARNRARTDAPTLAEFLKSLNLDIDCAPMRRDQLPRISQLTQRTNQFNASTIRRSESDVIAFCDQENAACLAVQVKDRFGDYGLVGAVLYNIVAETLIIDTFLLSCRVLGRGVEHNIIEHLSQIAASNGASQLEIQYFKTDRNEPVYNFLEQIGSQYSSQYSSQYKRTEGDNDDALYTIPVAVASTCSNVLFQAEQNANSAAGGRTTIDGTDATEGNAKGALNTADSSAKASKEDTATSSNQSTTALLAQIATSLHSVAKIRAALESQRRPRPQVDEPYVSPQTELEKSIADIWASALGIDKIGVNDKFTELGGGSLQIVQIHPQLEQATHSSISVMQLFTLPTVKSIAEYVNGQQNIAQQKRMIQARAQRQLAALQRHRLPRVSLN